MIGDVRIKRADGGKGSGNFGHAGRKGEVGGSAPSNNAIPEKNRNGDCYSSAVNLVMKLNSMGDKKAKLVHGIVTGQGALKGLEYSHAWVESGDMVLDYSNGRELVVPKELYYKIGKITKTKKYGYMEMLQNLVKKEHYGPWDKMFEGYP